MNDGCFKPDISLLLTPLCLARRASRGIHFEIELTGCKPGFCNNIDENYIQLRGSNAQGMEAPLSTHGTKSYIKRKVKKELLAR